MPEPRAGGPLAALLGQDGVRFLPPLLTQLAVRLVRPLAHSVVALVPPRHRATGRWRSEGGG